MIILYDFGVLLGFFMIMILFSIVAIVRGKNEGAWVWYIIGATIQLISLLGIQKTAHIYGTNTTGYWIVFFFLLITTAIIVRVRYSIALEEQEFARENYRKYREKLWACKKCGASNPPDRDSCQRCGTVRETKPRETEEKPEAKEQASSTMTEDGIEIIRPKEIIRNSDQ